MDRRPGFRLQSHRLRAIVAHGVVSTGAQTPASFGFQSPGDYATCNSNHTPDGTRTCLPSFSFFQNLTRSDWSETAEPHSRSRSADITSSQVVIRCHPDRPIDAGKLGYPLKLILVHRHRPNNRKTDAQMDARTAVRTA